MEFFLLEGKAMFILQRAASQWETFEGAQRPRPGANKGHGLSLNPDLNFESPSAKKDESI